jgi:alkaline phosphatase D
VAKIGGSRQVPIAQCAALNDPARTMLGAEQATWLDAQFAASKQRWNVLGLQTLFSPAFHGTAAEPVAWTDGWDGYPRSRKALLDAVVKRKLANPLFVGGDVHSAVVADVHANPDDPASPVIASEFCGTSVTSEGGTREESAEWQALHPHFRYCNRWQRGYTAVELTPSEARVNLVVVDEKNPASKPEVAARFAVAAGKPGPQAG